MAISPKPTSGQEQLPATAISAKLQMELHNSGSSVGSLTDFTGPAVRRDSRLTLGTAAERKVMRVSPWNSVE